MARRTLASVLAVGLLGSAPWFSAPAGALPASGPAAPPAPAARGAVPVPKAWILVDATSGTVLDAGNDRTPLPPASLTKLLTAVVATQTLQPTDAIAVSDRAAREPARKIGMKTGEQWPFQDALYCLLMSSANDAAAAIGERVGGSLEHFSAIMMAAGAQLGLADHPVLADPAGLDDSFSVAGGNLLSARDLAIIARAALAEPAVAAAVSTDKYAFVGPDGAHHTLTNHIHSFLTRYPGAIGLKPGFTRKAGSGLALAARRDGRTLISVVLDAPDPYGAGIGLLDRGFATDPAATGTGDVLPPVHLLSAPGSSTPGNPGTAPAGEVAGAAKAGAAAHNRAGPGWLTGATVVLLVIGPAVLAVVARRREVRRRRAWRLARRQAVLDGRITPMRRRPAPTPPTARRSAQR